MIIFPLFFMQTVSLSLCFDLKLEGAIHFGKDLIRRLNDDVPILPLRLNTLEGPPSKSPVQLMAAKPFDAVQRNNNFNEDIGDKPSPGVKVPEIFKMVGNTHETIVEPSKNLAVTKNIAEFRLNLKNQLSKKGCLRLKILAYFIKNNLSSHADITTILTNVTNDYQSAVEVYYAFISKKPIKYEIDKEFVVLDMVETTNKILMNEAKKLLDDLIEETHAHKTNVDVMYLIEKIKNTVLKEKQDQLRHVCKTLDVCRSFPGFCDHIADLLSEIIQLNDNNFKDVIKSYKGTITIKREFFKTITNANVYNILSLKLKDLVPNLAFMREVLSILRAVITQRHKIFQSDSLVLKVKTKAIRILLDLIDKAFEANDDELNSIDITNTISSYKKWAAQERGDLDLITKKFVYNAIEILNYSWSKETREEVKVLTDVLFTGTTNNTAVYDYLFKKGSVLVRDAEINLHSDIA